jgi:glycosyltransferase involved in cell wall biosynthesis
MTRILVVPSNPRDRSVWMAKDWSKRSVRVFVPSFFGLNTRRLRFPTYLIYCLFWSLFKRFDVIFCWECLPSGFVGLLIKLVSGKPLVTYVVDHGVNLRRSRSNPSVTWVKLMTWSMNLAAKHANLLIAIDNSLIPWLGNWSKRIKVIPFGVKMELFDVCPKPHDKVNVLYIGGFEPHHGVHLLLEASKMLSERSNFHFYFIGPPETTDQKNVTFTGWVPYTKLMNYVKIADIMVVPPCPKYPYVSVITNKLMEAMASGKAIIATKIGGIPKFEDCLYLVNPKATEIAEAIADLASHRELRRRLAISSRSKAKEIFDWHRNVEKILESIQKVLV